VKPTSRDLRKTILHAALRGELTNTNPDEWDTGALGDFLVLNYGKAIPKEDRSADGIYPVYGANGVLGRTDKLLVSEPAIIIGRKGSAGAINLVPAEFWPSDVTYYVVAGERFDIKFLYYLLNSLDLESLAIGIKPGINRKYWTSNS
jgi:type I restriction enzyme S subunit